MQYDGIIKVLRDLLESSHDVTSGNAVSLDGSLYDDVIEEVTEHLNLLIKIQNGASK